MNAIIVDKVKHLLRSRETMNNTKEENIRNFKNLCNEWYELFKMIRKDCDHLFNEMDMLMKKVIS